MYNNIVILALELTVNIYKLLQQIQKRKPNITKSFYVKKKNARSSVTNKRTAFFQIYDDIQLKLATDIAESQVYTVDEIMEMNATTFYSTFLMSTSDMYDDNINNYVKEQVDFMRQNRIPAEPPCEPEL